MNDHPRRTLKRLFQQYGQALVDDPRRTEALLRDYCGQHRREIFVLVNAQKQNIPVDLLSPPRWIPATVLHERLSRRLQEKLALTQEAADWAVNAWAGVLGVSLVPPQQQQNRWFRARSSNNMGPKTPGADPQQISAKGTRRQFFPSDVQLAYRESMRLLARFGSVVGFSSDYAWGRYARSLRRSVSLRVPKSVLWVIIGILSGALMWSVWIRGGDTAQIPIVSSSFAFPTVATVTELATGNVSSVADKVVNEAYPLPRSAWVDADHLNVRSGPTVEGPPISGLSARTRVTVVEFTNDATWARISEPEQGWVSLTYLFFEMQGLPDTYVYLQVRSAQVGTARLDVYDVPNPTGRVQNRIAADATVIVVATTTNRQWSHIVFPVTGWVPSKELR